MEKAVRFGNAATLQANSQQQSLFGDSLVEEVTQPALSKCEPWSKLEALGKEKEVIGFYISGHPLDDFKFEIKNFCSHTLPALSTGLPGPPLLMKISKLLISGISFFPLISKTS